MSRIDPIEKVRNLTYESIYNLDWEGVIKHLAYTSFLSLEQQ